MRSFLLSAILIISVLLILTACTQPAPAPSGGNPPAGNAQTGRNTATDEPTETSVPSDSVEIPGVDGTTETAAPLGTIPQSDLPQGWREDIPLLQGFEIQTFTSLPNDGMFALTKGNVNPDAAYNFYKALPGWEPDPDAPVGQHEDDRSIGLMKGDTKLTIDVIVKNGETLLNFSARN